jgi:hypothetical protein
MTRDLLNHFVIHPPRRLKATLVATLATPETDDFETEPVERLELALNGISGDRHTGFTRLAGAREPWYRRGAEMRSGRQISVVSSEELWEIGYALGLPPLEAGWIGANLVVEGIARLSFLPAGTRMFFPSGASVVIEGQNAPCRHAGRAVARHTERPGDEISFPKAAKRLRGLVASVEHAGPVSAGDAVTIHLPEQWIY